MGSSSAPLRVSNRRSLPDVDEALLDDLASATVEQGFPGTAEGVLQPGEGLSRACALIFWLSAC